MAQVSPSSDQVPIVTHTPLPIIINGKRPDSAESANQAKPELPANGAVSAAEGSQETLVENVISFDPNQLELDLTEGNWQLRSGSVMVRDCGRSDHAARQLLLMLRQLRVNQHGTVGQRTTERALRGTGEDNPPVPIMEYWLCDGQPPQGLLSGVRLSPLDLQSLRVEKSYGQWCLRDAFRMLFNFERSEPDANKALAILRKYQFTQVAVVSSSNPPILLFLTRMGDGLEGMQAGQGSPMNRDDRFLSFPVLQSLGNSQGRPQISPSWVQTPYTTAPTPGPTPQQ
jgi:hypothetical protein